MYHRAFTSTIAVLFLLAACAPNAGTATLPAATATQSAIVTPVPATQTLPSAPVTQTAAPESAHLEVIQAGNWSRLQLLKTFPAETPLSQSAIAISPDGRTMAVGAREGANILYFDLATGRLLQVVPMNLPYIGEYFNYVGMEYLPDGTILANSNGPYMIYHIDTVGNILSAWDGISFAVSADKRVMAYDKDGITLVEIAHNIPLATLEDSDAMYFSFSPDGSKIASESIGVDYLYTEIWDIPNSILLTTLDETANPRFSPDGKFLAVTKYDYENDTTPVKIFSPDGATEVATLDVSEPSGLNNRAPLWSLDGSVITAQIGNGAPAAWESTNWQLLETPALQGEIHSFSPDGRMLITRTADGSILLWGVPIVLG